MDHFSIHLLEVLSALDVAVCSRRCRGEYLAVLRRIRLKQPAKPPSQYLGNFIVWLTLRGVTLPSLRLGRSKIKPLVQQLARSRLSAVPSINTVSIFGDQFADCLDPAQTEEYLEGLSFVGPLLSFFPATKALEWHDSLLPDFVLLQFRTLRLESLDLSATQNELVPASLFLVIHSMRGTLRELKCAPDDETLAMMASDCVHLKSVTLNCKHLYDVNGIVCFFQQRGEQLEELELSDSSRRADLITNELVQTISKLCSNVTALHATFAGPHNITTWMAVLTNCCRLVEVAFKDTHLRINRVGYCNVILATKSGRRFQASRCFLVPHVDGCDVKMRGLRDEYYTIASDKDMMLLAAGSYGADLEELCFLCVPRKEEFLTNMLSRCPALTMLQVDCCQSVLSDACLSMLAACCPKITALRLTDAKHISDAGVISMLQAYQANAMQRLSFRGCSQLTDATLLKIAELFHASLSSLDMQCTAITKEAVQAVGGKLKVAVLLANTS